MGLVPVAHSHRSERPRRQGQRPDQPGNDFDRCHSTSRAATACGLLPAATGLPAVSSSSRSIRRSLNVGREELRHGARPWDAAECSQRGQPGVMTFGAQTAPDEAFAQLDLAFASGVSSLRLAEHRPRDGRADAVRCRARGDRSGQAAIRRPMCCPAPVSRGTTSAGRGPVTFRCKRRLVARRLRAADRQLRAEAITRAPHLEVAAHRRGPRYSSGRRRETLTPDAKARSSWANASSGAVCAPNVIRRG